MNKEKMEYIRSDNHIRRIVRTELLLTPLLVALPFLIGILFIYDWYNRGFVEGASFDYLGTLMLGIIILVGNIIFDIPFIRSLINFTRAKNSKK